MQQQQEKAKAEANKPKPALAAPTPPAPPKPKPVAEVVNPPAEEVLKKENASESDSERAPLSRIGWRCRRRRRRPPLRAPAGRRQRRRRSRLLPKEKENNKADAQPTGKGGGLPALSNNLLFQLD